jgi:hypothetical protein
MIPSCRGRITARGRIGVEYNNRDLVMPAERLLAALDVMG